MLAYWQLHKAQIMSQSIVVLTPAVGNYIFIYYIQLILSFSTVSFSAWVPPHVCFSHPIWKNLELLANEPIEGGCLLSE